MTKKELSQLFWLRREIEQDRRRLAELERLAELGAAQLTGMPRASGTSDRVARYAIEIADLRGIIEAKTRQCLIERARLERYIANIDDSLTRQIFTYRFVDGLSWRQVAFRVGGNHTADSVRMICTRQLESEQN